jgi:predicted dehydrogenase
MKILLVGLGSIGQRHLRNLRALGITDISVYRSLNRPLQDSNLLEGVRVFTDLKTALLAGQDAVIICNPTTQHIDVAISAAEYGCNLFIEKPLSHSWERVEELLHIVRERNLVSVVGFDLRFDPGLCKMKILVDEGHIGRVIGIQVQVGQYLPDWRPLEDYRKGVSAHVKTGGGVILDLVHELDYVSWVIGRVSYVSCFADKVSHLEIETEDIAAILLRFENGTIGTVHMDYIQRVPSRTCRIIGDEGTIVWDYYDKKVKWFRADKNDWEEFEYTEFGRNDRFLAEMRHLIACLRREEQPKVDLLTASQVLKLALAAKESARTREVCDIAL